MKYLPLVILFILNQNLSFDNNKLKSCIIDKEFITFFQICKKEESPIVIYDITESFKNFTELELSCGKKIKVQPNKDYKLNINSHSLENIKNDIVIYKIEKKGKLLKIYFIDTLTNGTLTLQVNKNDKIKVVSKGAF